MLRPGLRALVLLAGLLPATAHAAALAVAPTRLDLDPDRRVASVTVRNNEPLPVMIQVQTFAWPAGAALDELPPTRELVAVPAISTIQGNSQQVVRVAVKGRTDPRREAAFRLVISEVPKAASNRGGVTFALAFSLPVFVKPHEASPKIEWSVAEGGGSLRAVNRGTAHLQLQKLELGPKGAATRIPLTTAYILPGGQLSLPIAPSLRTGAGAVPLRADTDIGAIETVVPAPGR